jgi:ribonuclease P protein subunit RPR2
MEPVKQEVSKKSNKIKKCAGKDSFQRMNYLYQACNALATENESDNVAAAMYSNLLVAVSKKAVQRLDIEVKRTICKGCRSLLLAGVTCKVRIKKKRSIWSCMKCNTTKTFLLQDPGYEPWSLQDESLVDVLEYKP